MHLKSIGKKLVVVLATAVAMTGGLPAAEAAGGATCGVVGQRYDSAFANYNMLCSGTSDLAGNWQLTEFQNSISGVGPRGETVTGEVTATWPICVSLQPFTYCKTVTLTVCVDNWCKTVTVTICITYPGPGVTVCVETANRGPFEGNGTMNTAA